MQISTHIPFFGFFIKQMQNSFCFAVNGFNPFAFPLEFFPIHPGIAIVGNRPHLEAEDVLLQEIELTADAVEALRANLHIIHPPAQAPLLPAIQDGVVEPIPLN